MTDTNESAAPRRLTRGGFLGASAAAVGGFAFAGGGTALSAPRRVGAVAHVRARPSATDVSGFIRLSELVTGVEKLPRDHAAAYLEALDAAGLEVAPSRLVRLGGFADGGPATLAEFQRSALYRKRGVRASAEAVASAWWSGIVPTSSGGRVVTFLDALAWRAQPWAEPFTECLGATGAWAKQGRI
jgi:hypothetical protein